MTPTSAMLENPPADHAVATYRAAVVHSFTEPLTIERGPEPRRSSPGQIRVKVEASGLCHTDIHAAHGDWPVKPTPPFIPGHEGVGIVARARARRHRGRARRPRRDAVARLRVRHVRLLRLGLGDALPRAEEHGLLDRRRLRRVRGRLRAATSSRCPTASIRSTPRRSPAPASRRTRRSRSRAPARPTSSRSSASAGSATWRSSTRASPAAASSPSTCIDEKLELARELGAEFTVNAAKEDPVAAIQKLGGADQAIALAVSPKSFEQAFGSLRRGGTLVFVALPADNEMTLPIFETVLNGITVVGSIVGTRTDLREVFELHAAGQTTVTREIRPLERGQRVDRRRRGGPRPRADRVPAVTSVRIGRRRTRGGGLGAEIIPAPAMSSQPINAAGHPRRDLPHRSPSTRVARTR